jgi:UDP-N-acetylglucosamine 1-carboxyvinyltransferase
VATFLIKGGKKLKGKIKLAGNKNSALKLMAATLLGSSPSTLTNVPIIRDVQVMGELIKKLGAKVEGLGKNTLTIDPTTISSYELDPELTERIRASVVLAAPLLARFGKAIITPPGGDQIGERLLDTHFSMLRDFGVEVSNKNGKYLLTLKGKGATDMFLEEASVTATEMGLMLASSLNKKIQIKDTAAEPHVEDLAIFINKMGAKIQGAGTNNVQIKGRKRLKGAQHKVIPDHIEGGTFAIAAAITGGKVILENIVPEHYHMILNYLSNMGVKHRYIGSDKLEISPSKLIAKKRKFQTRPWPGFPTDLMSPFIVLATQTEGTILCHDWMYEYRMFFVDDLNTMGANIFVADPHRVIISGPTRLNADVFFSKDIRAGMSMVLAALVARGESEIRNIEMIERGYEKVRERFNMLGADIKRIE